MKKVGIDARLISKTGVGRYIKNLLYYLKDNVDFQYYIYLLDEDFAKIDFAYKNFTLRKVNCKWHTLREQIQFLKKLNSDNLDLMHFTYFSYPLFYNKKFVITIHDLTPYFYKTGKATTKNVVVYQIKHFFYKILIKNAVRNARSIITPSQSVKSEIINIFSNQYTDKIQVIYEGPDKDLIKAGGNEKLKKDFSFPFFIYVGNFYPHKNVENLVKAFSTIKNHIKLILIGPSDFFSKHLLQLINQLKQNDKIILYNNPTNQDLVFFYKNARALIHPSLSEGFGLPLIEAAYFNCPIIASDIPVFNEILGDKFLKFNPKDVSDIKDKIVKQIDVGTTRLLSLPLPQRFSFKEMAEETLILYKQILS